MRTHRILRHQHLLNDDDDAIGPSWHSPEQKAQLIQASAELLVRMSREDRSMRHKSPADQT